MNFSALFIRRPVATTLLTLGLALAGVTAYLYLPVSPLPRVDFPTIFVQANLPGADPETMATSVAAPLERQFGQIAGLSEMTSSSTRGSTSIVLQFDLDRNIDGAARDVQAAINAARGFLPPNLPNNPIYRKVNPAEAPVLILALTSDTIGTPQMYDAATTILQQKLSQVKGVGQVFVGGSSLPAVRVEVNPLALSRYGISLETVRGVLASTNVNRPKGRLSDGARTWEIQANDQLRGAAQYEPLVVAYRSGAAVRLPDIASVQDSVEDVRTAGFVNSRPAVMVIIFRQPEANIIETVDSVRALLPQMEASLPGGIKFTIVQDRTPSIRGSLRDIERTLVMSSILVVLVVFAFLRNARSTFIPATAIAVSLIGTFAVMYLFDYNLDNLSLMALTIATGFVVDDAIVVLENITRYIEQGLSPVQAALRGSKEIAFTVVSMSLSLIAVFTPILMMGGIVGRLFREFGVTLSAAVFISMVLSLTTTPMMCAALLKPERARSHGRIYRASERAFDRLRSRYDLSLRWSLGHPRFMLAITILTLAVNIGLFLIIPKGFFPEQDTGRISGTILAEQDISFQSMKDKLLQVVKIIQEDPDVESVTAFTGATTGTNTGRMFIALNPFEQRKATAGQVIARLRGKLSRVAGAPTYLQPVQDLRIGGRLAGALYQYTLQGDNLAELNSWSVRMLQSMRSLPQLADVNSDLQNKGLQASLVIDRPTASRLGITPQLVDNTLYDAFGQRQVSITYTLLNQYHVVMAVEPRFWQRPESLQDIYVVPPSGSASPLSVFSSFERTGTFLTVNHQGQFPAVTISFNLMPGAALGDAVASVESTAARLGLPSGIRGSFQGTAQAFQSSLASEPYLILAALAAVYIVLGILYESYVHPITILSTLPSAGVGAVLALMLFRMDLTVIALIGVILLIGIVKKNGIMMVDFALETERREGKSPEEAIYHASLLRFRPIMMTTMAAMLGALPLALGTGIGSEIRRPLGVAIVGGLVFSQMLTLFTTPVIYLYLDRFRLWATQKHALRRRAVPQALTGLILVLALVAGCKVGPDYRRPPVETPPSWKETQGWKPAVPQDAAVRGKWWEAFNDPVLNNLEEQVIISNQNIAQAEAQYRQALAAVDVARAGFYPVATIGATVIRSRSSGTLGRTSFSSGNTFTDYRLPANLTWELDVWGRIRRQVEAGEASAQASAADIAATRLSSQALLAQDYFQLRILDAQKQVLDATVAAYTKNLELVRNRYAAGVASRGDVLLADTQLKTAQAQAIDVGVLRAQMEHAVAVLCGRPAPVFSITPASAMPAGAPLTPFTLPAIPAGLPSELLERRPDIAAAERAMASANAQIGVAVAGWFPTVTLNASGGFESTAFSDWFKWASRFWSLGPSVTETVFNGFLTRFQTAQARAAYEATIASYRQTVLAAFQDVEDNLAALRVLEQEAAAQDEAIKAAWLSVEVAMNQYKAGTYSYLNVITAQAAALNNQLAGLNILNRRMAASVLLIRALGGGWDRSADERVGK